MEKKRAIEINGMELLVIDEVASRISCSKIQLLGWAKAKKIFAVYVGGEWFIEPQSAADFQELVAFEQQVRQKHSGQARTQVRHHDVHAAHSAKTSHVQAVGVAAMVLALGLVTGGVLTQPLLLKEESAQTQIALTPVAITEEIPTFTAIQETPTIFPVFSEQHAILSPQNSGVFVLPVASHQIGNQLDLAEVFSDPVKVEMRNDGSYVVKKQLFSATADEDIPVVIVPIADGISQ